MGAVAMCICFKAAARRRTQTRGQFPWRNASMARLDETRKIGPLVCGSDGRPEDPAGNRSGRGGTLHPVLLFIYFDTSAYDTKH
jgi:hypothetical protein